MVWKKKSDTTAGLEGGVRRACCDGETTALLPELADTKAYVHMRIKDSTVSLGLLCDASFGSSNNLSVNSTSGASSTLTVLDCSWLTTLVGG
jgi:hypothetical protein